MALEGLAHSVTFQADYGSQSTTVLEHKAGFVPPRAAAKGEYGVSKGGDNTLKHNNAVQKLFTTSEETRASEDGNQPLITAYKNDNVNAALSIIEKQGVNTQRESIAPIALACREGASADMILKLFKWAKSHNIKVSETQKALCLELCAAHCLPNQLEIVLEQGIHPDNYHSSGSATPLIRVLVNAKSHREHMADALIRKGASLEVRDSKTGNTPLMHVAQFASCLTLLFILSKNTKLTAINREGNNALHFAVCVGKLRNAELIAMKDNSLMSLKNAQGWTPFQVVGRLMDSQNLDPAARYTYESLTVAAIEQEIWIIALKLYLDNPRSYERISKNSDLVERVEKVEEVATFRSKLRDKELKKSPDVIPLCCLYYLIKGAHYPLIEHALKDDASLLVKLNGESKVMKQLDKQQTKFVTSRVGRGTLATVSTPIVSTSTDV
ncbi:MAG: hypothetical protein ACPGUD_02650 [Parashewanella sp.]